MKTMRSATGLGLAVSIIAAGLTAGVLLQGCAHSQVEKDVDAKLAGERTISSYSDLRFQGDKATETAPGLSDDQRTKLQALRDSTRANLNAQWATTLKLRSILIKDMLATKYDESEVEAIKDRMKNLEDARLGAIYDAVKKADAILGREARQSPRVLRDFWEESAREPRSETK